LARARLLVTARAAQRIHGYVNKQSRGLQPYVKPAFVQRKLTAIGEARFGSLTSFCHIFRMSGFRPIASRIATTKILRWDQILSEVGLTSDSVTAS
jgi:hypothetical protein